MKKTLVILLVVVVILLSASLLLIVNSKLSIHNSIVYNTKVLFSFRLLEVVTNINEAIDKNISIDRHILEGKLSSLITSCDQVINLLTVEFPPEGREIVTRRIILNIAIKKQLGSTKDDFSKLAGQCFTIINDRYFGFSEEEDYFVKEWSKFK